MLLREVVLLVHVPLQRGEDVALVEEVLAAAALELEQRVVGDAPHVRRLLPALGRDREVLELLAEHDDRLLRQQRVLRRGGAKVERRRAALEQLLLRGEEAARVCGRPVELVARMLEEAQNVVEAVRVKLRSCE